MRLRLATSNGMMEIDCECIARRLGTQSRQCMLSIFTMRPANGLRSWFVCKEERSRPLSTSIAFLNTTSEEGKQTIPFTLWAVRVGLHSCVQDHGSAIKLLQRSTLLEITWGAAMSFWMTVAL